MQKKLRKIPKWYIRMRDQILRPIREIFEEEKNRISNSTDWKAKRDKHFLKNLSSV